MIFFFLPWIGWLVGWYGYSSGSVVVFWLGALVCLIANDWHKPFISLIFMFIASAIFDPWYQGAANGLIVWTAVASIIGTVSMAIGLWYTRDR